MKALTFIAILVLPVLSAAQTPGEIGGPPVPLPSTDPARICDELPDGTRLKLALVGGGEIDGRWAGHDERHLFLLRDGERTEVPADEILVIWERERVDLLDLTAGAVLGALAGGLAVTLGVAILGHGEDLGWLRVAVGGVAVGAAGGMVVGAGAGDILPKWRRIFARNDGTGGG